MSRTPLLTTLLWTTVGAAALAACGDSPAPIVDAAIDGAVDASADAFVGPLAQLPASLALTATCGDVLPATADLTVQNVGTTTLTISGVTVTGGFSVTTEFPIDVAAGASTTLAVRPPAAVIGTDLGGSTKTGVLGLNSNQPGTSGTVALTSTVQGANLAFENASAQPITQLDLTTTDGSCPAPVTVFLRNTGNVDLILGSASASTGFTLGSFSSSVVAAGSTVSHDVRPLTFGSCVLSDTFQYQVTGTVCVTTPVVLQANLNITGTSTCFCS